MVPDWVGALVAPGRALTTIGGRVLSALDGPAPTAPTAPTVPTAPTAPAIPTTSATPTTAVTPTTATTPTTAATPTTRYDRHARAYDRLVGNWAYNQFVWRSSPTSYTAFAAEALAGGSGPLLDVGCGTALFTAEAYRTSDRPLVLVDRSAGMLARAAERLADTDPQRVVLLQADLFDLPFRPGGFGTVVSYGLAHLFDDPASLLRVLASQRAPGGEVYATSLVAGTALAGPVLRLLHLLGETAPPRGPEALTAVARDVLGPEVQVVREGGMAFLRSR